MTTDPKRAERIIATLERRWKELLDSYEGLNRESLTEPAVVGDWSVKNVIAQLKALHYMHCPKDGMPLESVSFQGLQIERCYHCHGTWLDAGELESLAGKEPGFIQKVISVFKGN